MFSIHDLRSYPPVLLLLTFSVFSFSCSFSSAYPSVPSLSPFLPFPAIFPPPTPPFRLCLHFLRLFLRFFRFFFLLLSPFLSISPLLRRLPVLVPRLKLDILKDRRCAVSTDASAAWTICSVSSLRRPTTPTRRPAAMRRARRSAVPAIQRRSRASAPAIRRLLPAPLFRHPIHPRLQAGCGRHGREASWVE